jgi:hypothetical protein
MAPPVAGFNKHPENINRNGRPKGISITEIVRNMLSEVPEEQKETYAMLLVKRMFHKAIVEGDVQMQKAIWAYMDGLPKETVEHSGQIHLTYEQALEMLEDKDDQGTTPQLTDGTQ